MWEYIKEIFADLWLLACLAMNLVIFVNIAITGSATIIENNPVVLWVEIGLNFPILAIAVDRLRKDLRR